MGMKYDIFVIHFHSHSFWGIYLRFCFWLFFECCCCFCCNIHLIWIIISYLCFKKIYFTRYGIHLLSCEDRPTGRPIERQQKKGEIYTSMYQTDTKRSNMKQQQTITIIINFVEFFVDVFLFIHFRSSFFVSRSVPHLGLEFCLLLYYKNEMNILLFFIILIGLDCAHTFWMIGIMKETTEDEKKNFLYFSSHLYLCLGSLFLLLPLSLSLAHYNFIIVIATTEPLPSSQPTNVHGIRTKIEIYIQNSFTMTKIKATFEIHNQFSFWLFVLCHQFFSNSSTKMSERISSSAPTKLCKWFTISAKKNWFINTHNA